MPLPVITNVFRVALTWSSGAMSAVNVMHFSKAGGTSDDLYDKMSSHVNTGLWDTTANSASIDTVTITPLDGTSASTPYTTGGSGPWVGNASGDGISSLATIVKMVTPLRGRSFRGRLYLPFPGEGVVAYGLIPSGRAVTQQAAWVTFGDDMVTDGWIPVVASYHLADKTAITHYKVELALGTQRRRQTRLR